MLRQMLFVLLCLSRGACVQVCVPCAEDSACYAASTCPPNSVEHAGGCFCNAGFDMHNNQCVPCPEDFYCTGAYGRRRLLSSGSGSQPCPENSQSITGADSSSMCLCNSGYTALGCPAPPCDPVCSACAPGTYKTAVSNVVDCEPCPADTYSSSVYECSACPNGTESAAGSATAASCLPPCAPGYTGPAGSCTQCAIGKYKNTSGSMPCSDCADGHQSYYGETACTACVPGKYDPGYGSNCAWCPIGKASATYAASSEATCEYCAPGQYSDISDPAHGYDTCVTCPRNSSSNPSVEIGFGNDYVNEQCYCNAGYAVLYDYPWHYTTTDRTRVSPEQLCQPCKEGTYQPSSMQWREISYTGDYATCIACPAHKTSTAGSAACVCRAGFYGATCEPCGDLESSAPGALTAADCRCRAGFFRSHGVCEQCAVGFFREFGEQELECTQCPQGSSTNHNASNSSSLCVVCAPGSFVSADGACVPCPPNSDSVAGSVSCVCAPGYSADAETCVPCALGFFKPASGNHACTQCPPGTEGGAVTPRVNASDSCVPCSPGTFWEDGACEACGNNSFSATGAVGNCTCNAGYALTGDACVPCAAGSYWLQHTCLPCSGAEYNPYVAATACLACPPNSYGGFSNTADIDCQCNRGFTGSAGGPCVACAAGKYKSELGSAACSNCSSGAYLPATASQTSNECLSCPANSSNAGGLACVCDRGFVDINGSCAACREGSYCPDVHTDYVCPSHSTSQPGAWELAQCVCVPGFYGEQGNCTICPVDSFCTGGVAHACAAHAGTWGALGGASAAACQCLTGFYKASEHCVLCDINSFCYGEELVSCPANSSAAAGSTELADCVCTPGMRMQGGVCVACDEGTVCLNGNVTTCAAGASVHNFMCLCAAGSFCPGGELSCTQSACLPCPENAWCAQNTARACVANSVAPANSSRLGDCRCVPGFYRAQGACVLCPEHHVCRNDTLRAVADFDAGLRTLAGTADLALAVCAPGMFRTAVTDLCKHCPRNFYCPQHLSLPNVVRCYENEFTYSTGAESHADCLCQAGFKMTVSGDTTRCLPCSEGQRCQEGFVVEELCHLQNKVPSASHDACVCQQGFGMYNFQCQPCSPGFVKAHPGDAPCRACADGTYAANSTHCVACPAAATARPGSDACVCPPPYVWTGSACSLCAHDHFWHASECHACPLLAHSSPSADMPAGVAACVCPRPFQATPHNISATLVCTLCAEGQYEDAGVCVQCPAGAWAPEGSTSLPPNSTALSVCVCNNTCHSQRVDGSCAGLCPDTPASCTQCAPGYSKGLFSGPGNTDLCLPCAAGTYEPEAGAHACKSCPDNEWHELLHQTSVHACLCTAGFERNTSCTPCMPGHYKDWLGDSSCLRCAVATYNPSVQATACTSCIAATATMPALHSALEREAVSSNQSLVLSSNTTAADGATSVLQCACDVGQQPIFYDGSTRCALCAPGSFKPSRSHHLCTYCGVQSATYGHSLLHHYGQQVWGATDITHCLPCPAFSGQDEALIGPDALSMSSVADCLCFRGHELTASGCSNCSQYMIQASFSNSQCTHCPPGHFFVGRHVPCQLCDLAQENGDRHVGLVANLRDPSVQWGDDETHCVCGLGFERNVHGVCQACEAGKFRNSTYAHHCAYCPPDSFQAFTAQLQCRACPQHSSTLTRSGRVSVFECVCAAGFQTMSENEECLPCTAGTYSAARMLNESEVVCQQCPEHHYCPQGATQPLPCPPNETAPAGAQTAAQCQCPPGFERNQSACTQCSQGFFAPISSNTRCTPCPNNKTTLMLAATSQHQCVCIPGHEISNNSITDIACTPCVSGSFAIGFRNAKCTSCGWGTITAPSSAATHSGTCQCSKQQGLLQAFLS